MSLKFNKLEKEIGAKLLEGLGTSDIAQDLNRSIQVVKNCIHHMLLKTGMENRVALALHLVKYPEKLIIDGQGIKE